MLVISTSSPIGLVLMRPSSRSRTQHLHYALRVYYTENVTCCSMIRHICVLCVFIENADILTFPVRYMIVNKLEPCSLSRP